MEIFTKENFTKLAYMAVGAVVSNESKITDLVDEWVEKGKMTADDGKKFVDEMMDKSKEVKKDLEDKIKKIAEDWYSTAHVATTEQIEDLKKRVEALEKKVK